MLVSILVEPSRTLINPVSGFKKPKIKFNVVDLPAPLAPNKPYISPALTLSDKLFNALCVSNVL